MTLESIHQNINGVYLNDIEEGDWQPIKADHGANELAKVCYANPVEDTYRVEYYTLYEKVELVIDGDRFRRRG